MKFINNNGMPQMDWMIVSMKEIVASVCKITVCGSVNCATDVNIY